MIGLKLITEIIKFITKCRYGKGMDGLSSDEIWELEKTAREESERKGIEEGRALVPEHVEIEKTRPSENIKTTLRLKK